MRRQEFDALPLMLRVEDVMAVLDLGRTATYEAIGEGTIPSLRVGRAIRVPKHRLADMLGLSDDGAQPVAAPSALSGNGATTDSGQHGRRATTRARDES